MDVSTEQLFAFVCRNEAAVTQLTETVAAIENAPIPDRYLKQIEDKARLDDLVAISQSVAAVAALKHEFGLPSWEAWDLTRWKSLNGELLHSIEKLRSWTWQERSKIGEKQTDNRDNFEYLSHALNMLSDKAESFQDLLNSRYLGAENLRAAIIEGRAGTGKSHLLGKIAQNAAQEGRPIIFLLGQQLNEQSIWTQISKRLGLGNIDSESLLQALDAASAALRKRGLILIDAINEGAGARLWKNELGGIFGANPAAPELGMLHFMSFRICALHSSSRSALKVSPF